MPIKTEMMQDPKKLVPAFAALGREMVALGEGSLEGPVAEAYESTMRRAEHENPWFTSAFQVKALSNLGSSLTEEQLIGWVDRYEGLADSQKASLTVGIVMAGNIPVVGFHDLVCVLLSGHRFLGKLSSDDRVLLPFIASRLIEMEPALRDRLTFAGQRLEGFDAVIATGSNNTSRYFEYYFGKYPHIIRKNRNGVAVITGRETRDELVRLGEDVFLFFGLGCRSVSKLFVPEGYDFGDMLNAFGEYGGVVDVNKYRNNYDYYRSIYLINGVEHLDNGHILLTRDHRIASPPSVLYYEPYTSAGEVRGRMNSEWDHIQCIVSSSGWFERAIPFGMAQRPQLWDYADGLDTMEFLLGLPG